MEKMIPETEEAGLVQALVKRVEELEAENAALKEERRAAKVSALLKEGALDAEYILEKLGKDAEKKDFLEKRISSELESIMESRQLYTGDRDKQLFPIEGIDYGASIAMPIIGNGDILGAVVFLWSDGSKISPTETKLAQVAASFIGKQMEQ